MKPSFKIFYLLNLSILIFVIIWPIGKYIAKANLYNEMLFEYWIILMVSSVTICLTFLALNIYGIIKYKNYRIRFLIAIILVFVWIVTGIYQLLYVFINEVPI